MGRRRNLILLTVDAWRADFLDTCAGINLMPALEQVSGNTARCGRFYSTAPWTTPALISLLTGESPARHGVCYQWSAPREGSPGLALRLREAGYVMPNLCYLNGINGYQSLGFDPATAPAAAHSSHDDALIQALRSHRNGKAPFFLWYHYKFLHLPYWHGEESRRTMGIADDAIAPHLRDSVCSQFRVPREEYHLLAEDRDLVRRLYAAGVLDLNRFLEPIVEELLNEGLLDTTTVVLTADHGEELLDHGHVGHASTSYFAILTEEVLRVPLLIIDNRIQGPATISARLQGMDLYSTVLSLMGLSALPGPGAFDFSEAILDTRASLPPENRFFYFHSPRMGFCTPREKEDQIVEGISDGQMKFVLEHYGTPRSLLYDLAADPGEQHPRIVIEGDEDDVMRGAKERLAAVRSELNGMTSKCSER